MNESTAKPISVPDLGDPDRKRALNVLAQRRYRQRRREKMQSLESKVRSSTVAAAAAMLTPQISPTSPRVVTHPMDVVGMPNPTWNSQNASSLCQVQSFEPYSGNLATSFALDLDAFISIDVFPNSSTPQPGDFISNSPISQTNKQPQHNNHKDISCSEEEEEEASSNLTTSLQDLETSQFTFPDDTSISIPILATMKAGFNIATTLGCANQVWDITTLRTFTPSCIPLSPRPLPLNLTPTQAQQTIPHHAIFDIMPWPSVRTRIICVFAQPPHLRPESARADDAVMRLYWDLDDEREGVRVTGDDCYDGKNWEVGQTLYGNWWWAFDREVIENSNRLRRRRGVGRLALPERVA